MRRIITFVLIGLICLIIGVVAYIMFGPTSQPGSAQQSASTKAATTKETEKELDDTVSFSIGESFITNVKNSKRYLKTKISLGIKGEKSKAYYEKNLSKIKDIIIGVLRNKTEIELISPDVQQNLKDDIKSALREKLEIKDLVEIYIEEFIMQ